MQSSDDRRREPRWAPWAAAAIVALFLLACIPLAVWQFFTVNNDEPRYTVAGAMMLASGDYILPNNPWGGVRLLKPPLSYYYVAAGFSIFGQSLFGAKVFWLLSGGAILALVWALARSIGATAAGAAVAVAALAANLLFFRATLTHIPDIPMTLGITLGLVGFARILASQDGEVPAWAYYAAWIGVAWALFAKGLLAFALLALALALRLPGRGFRRPGRHETVAIGLALVLGGWWYAVVAFREPELLVKQFLGDQVTKKTTLDFFWFVETMVENMRDLFAGFIPFFLAAIPVSLGAVRRWRRPPREVLLVVLWCVGIVVLFSFGAHRTERYMLPAMPALAALIGLGFGRFDPGALARRFGRTTRILLPLFAVAGLLTAGVLYGGGSLLAAVGALLAFAVALWALWRLSGSGRPGVTLTLLAILPFGTVLSAIPTYDYLGVPSITDLSVEAIEEAGVRPEDVVFVRRWQLIERVGLRIGPIEAYRFALLPEAELVAGGKLVITTDPAVVDDIAALGYDMREEIAAPGGYPLGALVDAILARDFGPLRQAYGERIWIGAPS